MTIPTDGRIDLDALAELLPCPFCGAPAFLAPHEDGNGRWLAGCTAMRRDCAAQPEVEEASRAETLAAWNRRAAIPSVGEAGTMPGTDGFTMAVFRAADVPVGTKLYTHPAPAAGVKVKALPDDNDGVEQDAFEEWAKAEGFDMEQHPIHWLFLNKQTSAARKGWRAALRHAHARILSALDQGEPK